MVLVLKDDIKVPLVNKVDKNGVDILDVRSMFEIVDLLQIIQDEVEDDNKRNKALEWVDILIKCANVGINKENWR